MHDIAAIRAAHPIAETVAAAGVELRPSGRRLVGRCPFHRDRDPSFVVYPETASWFCFACDAGGDVIDFVGRMNGTSFKETAARLSRGMAALPGNVIPLPARRPVRPLAPDEAAVVDAAVAHYERTLETYPDVRSYLAGRGIALETARHLRVGYGAGGLAADLRRRGLRLDVAERLGLLADGRDRFAGRIVIPDLDDGGRATWFTGRALLERRRRYLNVRAPSPLLGLAGARLVGTAAVVVTEGPFDWLTAADWAIPAVALLGTHVAPTAVQTLCAFRTVYVALDADGAGRRATADLAAQLRPRAVSVALPAGVHDLNELGQQADGRDAFLRLLAAARKRREPSCEQRDPVDHARAA